jgi:hypothetical protein
MPRKRQKPIKFRSINDFPEKISAAMIQNSYLGFTAQYIRASVKSGKLKGVFVGNHCYMTRAQFIENFGGQLSA